MKKILLCALCVLVVQLVFSVASAQEAEDKGMSDPNWPAILIVGREEGLVWSTFGKVDQEAEVEGPLLDVQPQYLNEHYLVTGGSSQVALVRKVWKGVQPVWDWKGMEGVSLVSAVTTNWEQDGRPSLVLAADAATPRIFLAEAKARPKVKWEFKLPAKPLSVRVCPDSGNFLVTMEGSRVQEVFFEEDKVVWSLGPEDGLKDARSAIRGPWAKTYLVDAADGMVYAFNPLKDHYWKAKLPFIPSLPLGETHLSLFKKKGKRILMVSARFGKDKGARKAVYLLNAETGKVLSWRDRMDKGEYPDFLKVVPDLAVYQKKQ
jgi:hypothetical protein